MRNITAIKKKALETMIAFRVVRVALLMPTPTAVASGVCFLSELFSALAAAPVICASPTLGSCSSCFLARRDVNRAIER